MTDTKVRIQDDLYTFVNKDWIERTAIPEDESSIGAFEELTMQVDELLLSDLEAMRTGEKKAPNGSMQAVAALYRLAMDTERRNGDGAAPIMRELAEIDGLRDIEDLNAHLKDFLTNGIPLPFCMDVESDRGPQTLMRVMLWGPQTILPDTLCYQPENAEEKHELLEVWKEMTDSLLRSFGFEAGRRREYIADALAFDELIAGYVKSSEEWADYTASYNACKSEEITRLMRPLDFERFMTELFAHVPETVMVAEPRYFGAFSGIVNDDTFHLYKHWAYVLHYLNSTAYLDEDTAKTGALYSNKESGIEALPDIKKQSYQIVSELLSEPLGVYYGQTYMGGQAKADVSEMVSELIAAFKERIRNNESFSGRTKAKAAAKLDNIVLQIGYPDKCSSVFDELRIDDADSYYTAVSKIRRAFVIDDLNKLDSGLDRTEWLMPAHMVDADYSPTANTLVLPAAILQPPFYSAKQSRSRNLGGIGTIIGHEITHALDLNGAKYDENGCVVNWWTEEDQTAFRAKAERMIKQAEEFSLPCGKLNGTMTANENIADNGGMAVALHVMRRMPDADYPAFFEGWATIWREKVRPEYEAQRLRTDEHAPGLLRANMQPVNFPEWYSAFDVRESDAMYLPPEKRVIVW